MHSGEVYIRHLSRYGQLLLIWSELYGASIAKPFGGWLSELGADYIEEF